MSIPGISRASRIAALLAAATFLIAADGAFARGKGGQGHMRPTLGEVRKDMKATGTATAAKSIPPTAIKKIAAPGIVAGPSAANSVRSIVSPPANAVNISNVANGVGRGGGGGIPHHRPTHQPVRSGGAAAGPGPMNSTTILQ